MDYLSTANRDILVTEDGSFTQRYVYDENSTRISAEYGYAVGTKRGEGGENLQSDFAANDVRKVWYRASHLGSTLFAVDENGKVIFTGRVPHAEVSRYYDLIDVLAYPRHSMRLTELVTPLKPLEAMARTLFKAWFVDFEPVRAKIEGRWQRGQSLPGMPAHLYDLFPDRLVESELGEIPEGWEMQPLSKLLTIIGGGTPKTSIEDYWGGEIPWFSVVDTPPASNVFVVATEKNITAQGLAGSSARLIPKGTTIISARGTVGNLAIAGCDMTFNQSCYGLRGTGGGGDYFVYLTSQQMVDQLKSMAHGSVFSTITRQTFEAIQRPVPPPGVLTAFEGLVRGWFDAILSSVVESRTLAQLRDTLLPKLISGELRVQDAERVFEEASA